MANNVRLSWRFPTDDNMSSFTSETGNMLASNVMNSQPSIVWRSTSHTPGAIPDQVFTFFIQSTNLFTFVLCYNHNFSYTGTVKIEIATDVAFSSIVHEQEWGAIDPFYGFGEDSFGLEPFGGFSDDLDFPFFAKWLSAEALGLYVRITVHDPDNTDGYIQAGRIIAGDHWEPEFNTDWGHIIKYDTQSSQNQMRSGATRTTQYPIYRVLNLNFSYLSAFDSTEINDLIKTAQFHGNVFVSVYPELGDSEEQMNAMLGFLTSLPPLARNNLPFRNTSIDIKEAL